MRKGVKILLAATVVGTLWGLIQTPWSFFGVVMGCGGGDYISTFYENSAYKVMKYGFAEAIPTITLVLLTLPLQISMAISCSIGGNIVISLVLPTILGCLSGVFFGSVISKFFK